MKLSHSRLQTILTCPETYRLSYKMGFSLKETKTALRIGSAVHHGIEHSTDDLSEFYAKEGSFSQATEYTQEQELAESMVYGYLKHKDEIFENILLDEDTGDKLELIEEYHELDLTVPLESLNSSSESHSFRGIIDLLLLTDKGFIVIDYKTSSRRPDWDNYLEQLYRYVFMIETLFPEVPVYKLAIINLRKVGIRQKKTENVEQFRRRLRLEYELNEESYINYHVYSKDALDKQLMEDYLINLRRSADFAEYIDTTGSYYLNYGNLTGIYGRADYYDIFKRTPDAYVLYNIRDTILDRDSQEIVDKRDARQIDIDAVFDKKVLHKYEQFEAQSIALYSINESIEKEDIFKHISSNFKVDNELMELHWLTLQNKLTEGLQFEDSDKLKINNERGEK